MQVARALEGAFRHVSAHSAVDVAAMQHASGKPMRIRRKNPICPVLIAMVVNPRNREPDRDQGRDEPGAQQTGPLGHPSRTSIAPLNTTKITATTTAISGD